jgi:elongator complex protein 3
MPPPEKSSLLLAYHKLVKSKKIKPLPILEKSLTKRAVRTLSGVAVISVLTKPYPCPGNCLYCPTEKDMPKSYLSNEPAVMRAILNDFDPHRQIVMRLKALKANGHDTSKIELIVMGGTWSYHQAKYQTWFIKRCFEALNGQKSATLAETQKKNESAKHRCIGLTLETRPDYINAKEILRMREYGCTRVELGIQHIDDKILKLNKRGHTNQDSINAIALLKQAGFKINLHLMPGLPGSTPAKDLTMFKNLYTLPGYMPDMIKIYPCVVTKDAELYKWWKAGKYKPYSDKQLLKLIKDIKKITPPWVRITRLIRDIPEESIVAGNKITNLRQLVQEQSKKEGWSCQCLRCREVGHVDPLEIKKQKLKFNVTSYQASNGTEYFLSFDSQDGKALYAFLRLRINDQKNNPLPDLSGVGLVRELHTYGQAIPLGEKGEVQHLGLGKKLLEEAEKICRKNKLDKIAVISGIGVRKYYQKSGYRLAGTYMIKYLGK